MVGVATAIEAGVLEPGARLPSWQDLAVQLGVARGTVRTAYEKLAAAQLIEASRNAGDSNIARLYQHQGSPAGGPPMFRWLTATARDPDCIELPQRRRIARDRAAWPQRPSSAQAGA